MNTNTLITKALQLADLKNSKTFTAGELFTFLNDAYFTTYNEAIDFGENWFVKKSNGKVIPPDCYKIKRVGNDLRRDIDYKIENNTIIGNVSSIEYWPRPDTLFFDEGEQIKDLDPTFTNGKWIADGKLHDIKGNTINVGTYDKYYIGEKYVYGVTNDVLYDAIANTPLLTHVLFTLPNDLVPYNTEEKMIGYISLEITDYNENKNGLYNAIDSKFETVATLDADKIKIYNSKFTYEYELPIEGNVVRFVTDDIVLVSSENAILLLNVYSGKIWVKNIKVTGTPYVNLETMYGVVSNDLFNNTVLASPFINMDLDYPNNLFWDILIYRLAKTMRTKLQQDTTHINDLLQVAERNYYDSLKKNTGYCKIKDVYGLDYYRWRY